MMKIVNKHSITYILYTTLTGLAPVSEEGSIAETFSKNLLILKAAAVALLKSGSVLVALPMDMLPKVIAANTLQHITIVTTQ